MYATVILCHHWMSGLCSAEICYFGVSLKAQCYGIVVVVRAPIAKQGFLTAVLFYNFPCSDYS